MKTKKERKGRNKGGRGGRKEWLKGVKGENEGFEKRFKSRKKIEKFREEIEVIAIMAWWENVERMKY